MNADCGSYLKTPCPINEGGKIAYDAVVELFAADITLSQPVGPTVSEVRGGLAEDASAQGTTDVAFHATDPGSGVYEATVEVDGEVASQQVLNENGGHCRNVGGTSDGLPAFLYPQPCPAAVSADIPFDTTALANGAHHLVVSVADAAGNAATVLEREITVANPLPPGAPPPGSAAACAGDTAAPSPGSAGGIALAVLWGHHAGSRLRARYGAAHTLTGRLTGGAGGTPIPAAQLEVCEYPAYAGAQPIPLATPRTDAAGRFTLALPRALPSCTLRVAYRPNPAGPPAAVRALTLTVPAPLTLRIAPHTVPSLGAIDLSGRLRGGPLPAGGKPLVLEARAPGGRWLEFRVIRTGARGRFHYLYRFRLPGPAAYQFRVLSEAEAAFPFAAGVSNVVGVFER